MANSSNDGRNSIKSGPEILFRFSPEQIYKLVKLRIDMDDTHFTENLREFEKSWKILAQKLDIGADGPTCEDKWADCILAYMKWKNLATRSEIENQEESSKWLQTLVEWLSTINTRNLSSSNEIDGESQPIGSKQDYPDYPDYPGCVLMSDEEIKNIIKECKAPELAGITYPIFEDEERTYVPHYSDDDYDLFY